MRIVQLIALLAFLLIALHESAISQTVQPDEKPIPLEPSKIKPQDAIQRDTLPRAVKDSALRLGGIASDYPYSALQDTNYFRALRLKIPPSARFSLDAQRAMTNLEIVRKRAAETPWQIALQNMQVNRDFYTPDAREQVQRQVAIANAMQAPIVRPQQVLSFSPTFRQIGTFLGISEDVSPRLKYTVQEGGNIKVVVYNMSATRIATIFDKYHRPGTYEVTWNLKDDKGNEQNNGDYVMEVLAGDKTIARKRVAIGEEW
jgi:hypothetical protein